MSLQRKTRSISKAHSDDIDRDMEQIFQASSTAAPSSDQYNAHGLRSPMRNELLRTSCTTRTTGATNPHTSSGRVQCLTLICLKQASTTEAEDPAPTESQNPGTANEAIEDPAINDPDESEESILTRIITGNNFSARPERFEQLPVLPPHVLADVHDIYAIVTIHTAVCDVCHSKPSTVIFRCKDCSKQICSTCADKKTAGNRPLDFLGEKHEPFKAAYVEWRLTHDPKGGYDGTPWEGHGVKFVNSPPKKKGAPANKRGRPSRILPSKSISSTPDSRSETSSLTALVLNKARREKLQSIGQAAASKTRKEALNARDGIVARQDEETGRVGREQSSDTIPDPDLYGNAGAEQPSWIPAPASSLTTFADAFHANRAVKGPPTPRRRNNIGGRLFQRDMRNSRTKAQDHGAYPYVNGSFATTAAPEETSALDRLALAADWAAQSPRATFMPSTPTPDLIAPPPVSNPGFPESNASVGPVVINLITPEKIRARPQHGHIPQKRKPTSTLVLDASKYIRIPNDLDVASQRRRATPCNKPLGLERYESTSSNEDDDEDEMIEPRLSLSEQIRRNREDYARMMREAEERRAEEDQKAKAKAEAKAKAQLEMQGRTMMLQGAGSRVPARQRAKSV